MNIIYNAMDETERQKNLDTAAEVAVLLFEKIHANLSRRRSVEPGYAMDVAAQLASGVLARFEF